MHDVAVLGLGAMGSATVSHLAHRGARVIGVDAFSPPHELGSTHGASRIIREAYYEHPSYVPLVRRAYENWASLERETGARLFTRTGGLMIGTPGSGLVRGTLESAAQHDIPVEQLDISALRNRFPALNPADRMVGVLEERAGVLDPERCVSAYLERARANGAELQLNAKVANITAGDSVCQLQTDAGTITANTLILAAGAWTRGLLRMLRVDLPLVVERQTMHWFAPTRSTEQFAPDRLPITMIEHEADRYVYFIPDFGQGVKAAIHYEGLYGEPDSIERKILASDTDPVLALLRRFTPALSEAPTRSAVCLYTNTPDKHFLIDVVPAHSNVHMISACSGHGFKFASAIGEIVAARALGETPSLDLSQFRAKRLDFQPIFE
jgi:sarcosine oxidase